MNILFFLASNEFGGIRTVTDCLTEKFVNRGHHVTWLVCKFTCTEECDNIKNAKVYSLPKSIFLDNENIEKYNSVLIKEQINIIINQHGLYEGIRLLVKQSTKIPIISVLHSNPVENYDWLFRDCMTLRNNTFTEHLKRIARFCLFLKIKRKAQKRIVYQFHLLKDSGSFINVLSPRYIETVHRIDPSITNITAIANPNTYQNVTIRSKDKVALFVGRLDNRSKKIQYLIKIWKLVEREVNGWKLVIVGSGRDEMTLKKMAKDIKSIDFVGYHHPQKYYETASILCLTSLFEGFPMAITEGMQFGCVPIAFGSFPAIYDMIESGYNGEIIKPFNKKEYAKRLKFLMTNDEYRNELSRKAIETVKQYDTSNIVLQWEKLFNQICDNQ